MRTILRQLFLLFLLLTGNTLVAQVRFTATFSPASIGKNEFTQLEFTISNSSAEARLMPPSLRSFIVVSGPNPSTRIVEINGQASSSFSYSYILKPRSAGVFTVAPATAKINGKEYKSNQVNLRVSNQSQNNPQSLAPFVLGQNEPFVQQQPEIPYNDYILKKGEDVNEKVKKNIFLKVETDKTSCYAGEPIVATYKLYTRLNSESNLTQNPSFNGFSVIDLQPPSINAASYSIEKVNGREYNVYVLRKAQLYPLQPGQLELEPAEVENSVRFLKEEYLQGKRAQLSEIYQQFLHNSVPFEGVVTEKIAVKNAPLIVNVKPLPEIKKPASFKTAVGNFEIKVSLDKINFTTDDAGKLNVFIIGEGNMQLITAPEINWPENIEPFESKGTDDLNKMTVPVSGTKLFEFPFTVSKDAAYRIPAIDFSFFDVRSNSYKTISSEPLDFTVLKGSGKPSDSVTVNQPAREKFFNHIFSNRWMVIVPIIIIIILCLAFWIRKETRKEAALKAQQTIFQEQQQQYQAAEALLMADQADPLEAAKDCLEKIDSKHFYSCLNSCIREYLSKKLEIPKEELSKKAIAEKMDKKGMSNEVAVQLQQLMDEIEWQLYTASTEEEKMQDIYERADEMIQRIKLSGV